MTTPLWEKLGQQARAGGRQAGREACVQEEPGKGASLLALAACWAPPFTRTTRTWGPLSCSRRTPCSPPTGRGDRVEEACRLSAALALTAVRVRWHALKSGQRGSDWPWVRTCLDNPRSPSQQTPALGRKWLSREKQAAGLERPPSGPAPPPPVSSVGATPRSERGFPATSLLP